MEKLIWEYNELEKGWSIIHPDSIDENGNLKGGALALFETTKTWPASERGNCSSYWFRQTPESQIGIGDSNGKTVMIVDSIDVNEIL